MRALVDQETSATRRRIQDRQRKQRTRTDNTPPEPSRAQHAAALAETGYTYAEIAKTLGINSVKSTISRGRDRGPAMHFDLPQPATSTTVGATKQDAPKECQEAPIGIWLWSPAGSFTIYPATERGSLRLPELAQAWKNTLVRGDGIASFCFAGMEARRGDFTVVAEVQESAQGLLDRAAMCDEVGRTLDRLLRWFQGNVIVRTPVGRVTSIWTFYVQNAAHARGIPVIPAVTELPELPDTQLGAAISGAPYGSMKVVRGEELQDINLPRHNDSEAA